MYKKKPVLLLLMIMVLVLVACAAPAAEEPELEEPVVEESEPDARVLFMTEDPIGVNPYFISGQEGLERAAAEFNIETQIVEGTSDPAQNDENLRAAAREDWDLIILMTFGFTDTLTEIAPEYPDTPFVCIDCVVEAPNVRNVDFLTQEVAFLLGAAAGQLTETGVVGQVGPIDMPFMHRWIDPWAEGAKYVNPDVTILETLWVGDWADPATAKELALTLSDQGADHINGVAAAGNSGIFEAAQEQSFVSYGVDINECPKAPGYIVDSAVKRVDLSVYNSIKDFLAGEEMGGFVAYGLETGGVDLAVWAYADTDTECVLADHPEVIAELEGLRQQIIDGDIQIPDPLFGGEYVFP